MQAIECIGSCMASPFGRSDARGDHLAASLPSAFTMSFSMEAGVVVLA